MEKEKKIGLLVLIVIMGFSISVFYHYAQGIYLGKPYPDNTFLFSPGDKFNDFYNVVRGSADLDPYRPGKIYPYFAFGSFVAYLFSLIKPWAVSWLIFLLLFFSSFILLAKYYLYGLRSKLNSQQLLTIFVFVFLTYPVLFAVDRSNFDLLISLLIFLFAITYGKHKFIISTIPLAMAIAIKPYAVVFAIVYIINKKLKEALLLIFNTSLLTVFSLIFYKDGLFVEIQKFIVATVAYGKAMTDGAIFHFSSDLYNFLILIVGFVSRLCGAEINLLWNPQFKLFYAIAAIIIFILISIYLWKRPQPFWKVMAILTILIILLPYSTNDYRLTYLFIPLLMYLVSNNKSRLDMPTIILWGLLLIPKNYYTISEDQNIGMIINPLLLIGLLILLVFYRTPKMIPENKNSLYPVIQ